MNQDGHNFQPNWYGRNHDGQNSWGNRNQGNQSNWVNRSQNQPSSNYVHQRNYQSNNSNSLANYQGNQGPNANYISNQGQQENFPPNQGTSSSQPYPKQQRNTDDMVGDLLNTQQHLQSNMQSNNDIVHKLQDAQQEQKAAMDMLAKKMSQIATSLNEMQGIEGKIPASVKPPERANISQITPRLGREYKGPSMKIDEQSLTVVSKETEDTVRQKEDTETGEAGIGDDIQIGDLRKPLPRIVDPFFLNPKTEVENEEGKKLESFCHERPY
ncbi:GATA zinc finger domain-containing protein 14-like [Salvia splendens]|uniref:GATA zinc finger domain-containing protein 14-like n=1 Tax=Salvia splendens TaxID=180675 RepID=UPI001C26A753|nr:GATA zinc finger domain-containing protein 14-like [Salvia splendens]